MEKTVQEKRKSLYRIIAVGLMAALVYSGNYLQIKIPNGVLVTRIHFGNSMCLLAGLLFGPLSGGLAAGLGSFLYDALFGGYDIIQCLITFVSKFIMAWLCAKIAYSGGANADNKAKTIAASVIGALSYVALYMLKTFIYQVYDLVFIVNQIKLNRINNYSLFGSISGGIAL